MENCLRFAPQIGGVATEMLGQQRESEMEAIFKAARLLVAVVLLALPYVSPVAAVENEQVHFYNSPAAAAAKLPFSQAVRVGNILYLSGAIGVLPGKMELAPGGIEPET